MWNQNRLKLIRKIITSAPYGAMPYKKNGDLKLKIDGALNSAIQPLPEVGAFPDPGPLNNLGTLFLKERPLIKLSNKKGRSEFLTEPRLLKGPGTQYYKSQSPSLKDRGSTIPPNLKKDFNQLSKRLGLIKKKPDVAYNKRANNINWPSIPEGDDKSNKNFFKNPGPLNNLGSVKNSLRHSTQIRFSFTTTNYICKLHRELNRVFGIDKPKRDIVISPPKQGLSVNKSMLVNNGQALQKTTKIFENSYTKLTEINLITISLASANRIRQWAEKTLPNGKVVGEVINPETVHYKTLKPIKGGLFCERIFGPLKDHECACGKKFNIKNYLSSSVTFEKNAILNDLNNKSMQKRYFCRVCDVEYTYSIIRRTQLGYIELASPTTHVWFVKSLPSYISILLDMKKKHLQHVTYNISTLTLEHSLKGRQNVPSSPKSIFETWQKIMKKQYPEKYTVKTAPLNKQAYSINPGGSKNLPGPKALLNKKAQLNILANESTEKIKLKKLSASFQKDKSPLGRSEFLTEPRLLKGPGPLVMGKKRALPTNKSLIINLYTNYGQKKQKKIDKKNLSSLNFLDKNNKFRYFSKQAFLTDKLFSKKLDIRSHLPLGFKSLNKKNNYKITPTKKIWFKFFTTLFLIRLFKKADKHFKKVQNTIFDFSQVNRHTKKQKFYLGGLKKKTTCFIGIYYCQNSLYLLKKAMLKISYAIDLQLFFDNYILNFLTRLTETFLFLPGQTKKLPIAFYLIKKLWGKIEMAQKYKRINIKKCKLPGSLINLSNKKGRSEFLTEPRLFKGPGTQSDKDLYYSQLPINLHFKNGRPVLSALNQKFNILKKAMLKISYANKNKTVNKSNNKLFLSYMSQKLNFILAHFDFTFKNCYNYFNKDIPSTNGLFFDGNNTIVNKIFKFFLKQFYINKTKAKNKKRPPHILNGFFSKAHDVIKGRFYKNKERHFYFFEKYTTKLALMLVLNLTKSTMFQNKQRLFFGNGFGIPKKDLKIKFIRKLYKFYLINLVIPMEFTQKKIDKITTSPIYKNGIANLFYWQFKQTSPVCFKKGAFIKFLLKMRPIKLVKLNTNLVKTTKILTSYYFFLNKSKKEIIKRLYNSLLAEVLIRQKTYFKIFLLKTFFSYRGLWRSLFLNSPRLFKGPGKIKGLFYTYGNMTKKLLDFFKNKAFQTFLIYGPVIKSIFNKQIQVLQLTDNKMFLSIFIKNRVSAKWHLFNKAAPSGFLKYVPGNSVLVNNIYCISHRELWEQEKDWEDFAYYYYSPTNLLDKPIPLYKSRNYDLLFNLDTSLSPAPQLNNLGAMPFKSPYILKGAFFNKKDMNKITNLVLGGNLNTAFSGAGLIQTLLNEFNYTELKKMDKQNRILLFEYNKYIKKLKQKISLVSSKKGRSEFLTEPRLLKGPGIKQSFNPKNKKYFKNIVSAKDNISLKKENKQSLQKGPGTLFGAGKNRKRSSKYYKACDIRDALIRRTKLTRKILNTILPVNINSVNTLFLKERPNINLTASNGLNMILTLLPVLPPVLRPVLKMSGQFTISDLNRLYQRIIYRNERLKKFLKDPALSSSFEMKYAQRLLQESVDNLIQNGKSGVVPEKDARGRLLKSLSDILKGKQGRFRQYLLGKRVDYSGRSVIVVGPRLKLHECGIPKEMALVLYSPFLIKRILNERLADTYLSAKKLIKTNPLLVSQLLREIMKACPVLLNRAPTLHRLGFQAFQPKLVDGKAILLHPLVCPAFNADFDGDQMAVHVPITFEARAEAWKLMLARNNLLSPATGEPIILPSQDMVLGCYYLTINSKPMQKRIIKTKVPNLTKGQDSLLAKAKKLKLGEFLTEPRLFKGPGPGFNNFKKGTGMYFHTITDVLKAYNQQLIHVHAIIWVKIKGHIENGNIVEQPLEIRLPLKNVFVSKRSNQTGEGSLLTKLAGANTQTIKSNKYNCLNYIEIYSKSHNRLNPYKTKLNWTPIYTNYMTEGARVNSLSIGQKNKSAILFKGQPDKQIGNKISMQQVIKLGPGNFLGQNGAVVPIIKTEPFFTNTLKGSWQIIRTTPGKIFFNMLIKKTLEKRPLLLSKYTFEAGFVKNKLINIL